MKTLSLVIPCYNEEPTLAAPGAAQDCRALRVNLV